MWYIKSNLERGMVSHGDLVIKRRDMVSHGDLVIKSIS